MKRDYFILDRGVCPHCKEMGEFKLHTTIWGAGNTFWLHDTIPPIKSGEIVMDVGYIRLRGKCARCKKEVLGWAHIIGGKIRDIYLEGDPTL